MVNSNFYLFLYEVLLTTIIKFEFSFVFLLLFDRSKNERKYKSKLIRMVDNTSSKSKEKSVYSFFLLKINLSFTKNIANIK